MRPRKELREADVTAVVDTREQRPHDLAPMKMVRLGLDTGDYSVLGIEHFVTIERKSLDDLVACCGKERDRFERELARMRGFEVRAVVVEASWSDLEAGRWQSRIATASVTGSVLAWTAGGIPFVLAGNREAAGAIVRRLLMFAAKRRWEEAQGLLEGLKVVGGEPEEGFPETHHETLETQPDDDAAQFELHVRMVGELACPNPSAYAGKIFDPWDFKP